MLSFISRQAACLKVFLMFTAICFGTLTTATAADRAIRMSNVAVKPINEIQLPARQAGSLEKILVKAGSSVTTKSVIVRLNDKEAKLTLQHAMVEHAMAKKKAKDDSKLKAAQLKGDLATSMLMRALDANRANPGSVKASDIDQLRFNVANEKLAVSQATILQQLAEDEEKLAEVVLKQANEQLKKREITSPVAGVVTQVHKDEGEWVEPGETVLTVVKLDRLRVMGFLPVAANTGNLKGRTAKLIATTATGKRIELKGKVTFVNPTLAGTNKDSLIIHAEIENPNQLVKPGAKASLVIE